MQRGRGDVQRQRRRATWQRRRATSATSCNVAEATCNVSDVVRRGRDDAQRQRRRTTRQRRRTESTICRRNGKTSDIEGTFNLNIVEKHVNMGRSGKGKKRTNAAAEAEIEPKDVPASTQDSDEEEQDEGAVANVETEETHDGDSHPEDEDLGGDHENPTFDNISRIVNSSSSDGKHPRIEFLKTVGRSIGNRLQRFSGEDPSRLRPFLQDLDVIFASSQLTSREQVLYSVLNLTGVARAWAKSELVPNADYATFCARISERFCVASDISIATETITSLFANRYRPAHKTLNEFQSAIDLLAGLHIVLPDQLALHMLYCGLPPSMSDDLRARDFEDVRTAYRYVARRAATRTTSSHERDSGRQTINEPVFKKSRFNGPNRSHGRPHQSTAPTGSSSWSHPISGSSSFSTPRATHDKRHGAPRRGDQRRGASSQHQGDRACFLCGDKNHIARTCPRKTKWAPPPAQGGPKMRARNVARRLR